MTNPQLMQEFQQACAELVKAQEAYRKTAPRSKERQAARRECKRKCDAVMQCIYQMPAVD